MIGLNEAYTFFNNVVIIAVLVFAGARMFIKLFEFIVDVLKRGLW